MVIWLLSLIAYRMLIAHISGEPFKSAASPLANFSASLINLVVVMVTRRVRTFSVAIGYWLQCFVKNPYQAVDDLDLLFRTCCS